MVVVIALLSAAGPGAAAAGKRIKGGVATIGMLELPNYIFPFAPVQSVPYPNPQFLMNQLWPTLYSMNATGVDKSQSLADYPPKWSSNDSSVTIHLKPYKWSDGTTLTPEDVAFWMGLLASEKSRYGGYVPGYFPDNVASVSYNDSADTVTFDLAHHVNPLWFDEDQLATLTPLPLTWDLTAPGVKGKCASEDPATQASSCPSVYTYLTSQAQDVATYATNPLWRVVDGPWKLGSFQDNVSMMLVRNESYSGPVKPALSAVRMVAYTSPTALYDALTSGTSLTAATGLSPTNMPPAGSNGQPSTQPLSPNYTVHFEYSLALSLIFLNYASDTLNPLVKQLYIRQALQSLVDEATLTRVAYNGYASQEHGPVPLRPHTQYVTATEQHDLYPFSISNARRYLTSNGWTIPSSGAAYCSNPGTGPGDCGAGVAAGTKLDFRLEYYTPGAGASVAQDLQANALKAGIVLHLSSKATPAWHNDLQCNQIHAPCPWDLFVLTGGVSVGPYPTGERLLVPGAFGNPGLYNSAEMSALINRSITTDSSISAYEDYAAKQVPYLWIPSAGLGGWAFAQDLHGVLETLNSLNGQVSFNSWYLVK